MLAAIVAACGGGGSGGGGTIDAGGHGSTGVGFSVDTAMTVPSVAGMPPSQGDYFVVVAASLENTGAAVPLATDVVMFSLTTDQSLDYVPVAEQPESPCGGTVSVASGGKIQCQIAFQIPTGRTPTVVTYNDERGDTASASVPAIPPPTAPSAACETLDTWVSNPSQACSMCINSLEGDDDGNGPCTTANANYNACSTAQTCDQQDDTIDCACERANDSVACQAVFDTLMNCAVSSCMTKCP